MMTSMIDNIGTDNCLNSYLGGVEYFDKDKLYYILNHKKKFQKILKEQSEVDDDDTTDMLERVRKYFMISLDQGQGGSTTKTGHINVNYNNRSNAGRLFANNCLSLQNINHKIRHTIAGEYYIDVDMVNAHPVILEYICKELNRKDKSFPKCPHLSYYNSERNLLFEKYDDEGFDRDKIKKLILTIINGGKGIYRKVKKKKVNVRVNLDISSSTTKDENWICKFNAEMSNIRGSLRKKYIDRYERIRENERDKRGYGEDDSDSDSADESDADADGDSPGCIQEREEAEEKKYNYEGKTISSLMCDGENFILKVMVDFFKSKGLINSLGRMDAILCFDGIMINRRYWREDEEKEIIKQCEATISDKCDVQMMLKIKPMDKVLKLPKMISCRPNPNQDIFMYEEFLKSAATWENFCKIKYEIVQFINKDTYLIRGDKPMIIKENIKYDTIDEWSPDNIDRVFKIGDGYSMEMSNVKFRGSAVGKKDDGADIKSSDLNIDGYKLWITSKYRSDKSKIVFDPDYYYAGKPTNDVYNLFNGLNIERDILSYTIKPLDEDAPFFQHIKKIWCKGDMKAYNYVLNWFASIIKYPGRKLRSCIVLKSTERAGKGIIIDKIREIMGENYVFHPSSPKDILGDFNSGCRNKLLVFLDELVWGGDKERAGTFKKLTTEKYISINEKFKSVFTVKNLMNIIIASNESWVVPAGTTDTRWFCLLLDPYLATCSRTEKKRAVENILSTDIRRLAKFFYERDISDWDSDDIVITDELREQRIQSMSPMNKWWFDAQNSGYIENNDTKYYYAHDSSESKAGSIISLKKRFGSYIEYSGDRHMTFRSFNKAIRHLMGDVPIIKPRVNGVQIRSIKLPDLEVTRNIWREKFADADWEFEDPEVLNSDDDSADNSSDTDDSDGPGSI